VLADIGVLDAAGKRSFQGTANMVRKEPRRALIQIETPSRVLVLSTPMRSDGSRSDSRRLIPIRTVGEIRCRFLQVLLISHQLM